MLTQRNLAESAVALAPKCSWIPNIVIDTMYTSQRREWTSGYSPILCSTHKMTSLPFGSNLESLASPTLQTSMLRDATSARALWRDGSDHLWCLCRGSSARSCNLGAGTESDGCAASQPQLFLSPDVKADREQKAHKLLCLARLHPLAHPLPT